MLKYIYSNKWHINQTIFYNKIRTKYFFMLITIIYDTFDTAKCDIGHIQYTLL